MTRTDCTASSLQAADPMGAEAHCFVGGLVGERFCTSLRGLVSNWPEQLDCVQPGVPRSAGLADIKGQESELPASERLDGHSPIDDLIIRHLATTSHGGERRGSRLHRSEPAWESPDGNDQLRWASWERLLTVANVQDPVHHLGACCDDGAQFMAVDELGCRSAVVSGQAGDLLDGDAVR
jgi:hypothetical protein